MKYDPELRDSTWFSEFLFQYMGYFAIRDGGVCVVLIMSNALVVMCSAVLGKSPLCPY